MLVSKQKGGRVEKCVRAPSASLLTRTCARPGDAAPGTGARLCTVVTPATRQAARQGGLTFRTHHFRKRNAFAALRAPPPDQVTPEKLMLLIASAFALAGIAFRFMDAPIFHELFLAAVALGPV